MNFNIGQINSLIQNRRSIYPNMYSDEIVEDEVIAQMLENANWAPTHGLTEPWRFIVFKGEGLKRLANFQANLYKEMSMRDGTFKDDKFEKLRKKPLLASHIIAMKRNSKVPEIEEIEAVACAVQNMYLTATAYQIGCYWGSGGITYIEEAKSFFGLGKEDKLLGFMYVGIVKTKWPKGKRRPIEEKVKWEK